MDRVEVRGGDDWRTKINTALDDATVLLAIIGQKWLSLTDEFMRLRIDKDDDWVRREIRDALNHRKKLIPLYVDDAKRITRPESLPSDLRRMLDAQDIALTSSFWEQGLVDLIRRIESYGFELYNPSVPMPERRKKVLPLDQATLSRIQEELPAWTVTTTYATLGHRDVPIPRTELYREYRFKTFVDATHFMADTSPAIEAGQHHPRWENIWTTVRVWLSTWDIEFQPSSFDVHLAKMLDEAYAAFDGRHQG
jgi:pterin-4a-carbinolamine dehydratase